MKLIKQEPILLGHHCFSEAEIIDFAKQFDPLPFHTDASIAENSIFKGLVASGSQAFMYFYPRYWVPKFGSTVLAGMKLSNWEFLMPIYANEKISAFTKILKKTPHHENKQIIHWEFCFKNVKNQCVQKLELIILHRIV